MGNVNPRPKAISVPRGKYDDNDDDDDDDDWKTNVLRFSYSL